MVSHTLKTIYVVLHDAQHFGDEPTFKMEIHKKEYVSHKQLQEFRHRLESYIDNELNKLVHKPEYNGTWP